MNARLTTTSQIITEGLQAHCIAWYYENNVSTR